MRDLTNLRLHKGGTRRHEIVNVGRLIEQKNQKLLIDAFCKALPMIPDYKLQFGSISENAR